MTRPSFARQARTAAVVALLFVRFPELVEAAAKPKQPSRERTDVTANWVERLKRTDALLRSGEYKSAKKSIESLLEEMRERITGGEGAGRILAFACLYRAIAESGLGNTREAAWDFQSSQALFVEFSRADLSPYGAAGAALEPARWTPQGGRPTPDPGEQAVEASRPADGTATESESTLSISSDGQISKPNRIRGKQPWFPRGKYDACVAAPIVVESIITKNGFIANPHFVGEIDPVLGFVTLDALKTWEFEPATLGGRAINVYYNITINYRLSHCSNPAAIAAGAKP